VENPTQCFAVDVHPGDLHFNAAHFITLDGTCENLHGHNFHLRVRAEGANTGDAFVVDFVLLRRLAAEICAGLHDRVLLPGASEEVAVWEESGQMRVSSYGKRFALPADNCAVLPVSNTTAELLAWHVLESLVPALERRGALGTLETLEVAVEEADRQWGVCRRVFGARGRTRART
jgi:6-pyruvoyltetrahydropterin/6-carboxytetrahydropterin synthase